MSTWSNGDHGHPNDVRLPRASASSGILRQRRAPAPHVVEQQHLDGLLVFGYACKVFRDDERAAHIDLGRHLIPWMGDASLRIDRYDVRATMSDIVPFQAPTSCHSDQLASLPEAERRAEELCEEERYFSLYNNDVEEEMYKDEKLKRLHRERSSTYGQVQFSYDAQPDDADDSGDEKEKEGAAGSPSTADDDPFVVNPRFYVPPSIETPDTMKLHAVIEKTARFIAAQGPQMEILIKAKQSNNPQFEFLTQANCLNAYYKHMLNAMKNGYYPEEEPEPTTDRVDSPVGDAATNHAMPKEVELPPIVVPQIKYKPSADCAYTQLINRFKGSADAATECNANSNSGARESPDSLIREIELKHQQVTRKLNMRMETPAVVQQSTSTPSANSTISNAVEVKNISSALALAQCYGSDSESEDEGNEPPPKPTGKSAELPAPIGDVANMPSDFPIPSDDLQTIIDKTAAYVLKNGKEFESILRAKNDLRFSFLQYTDPYNRYYVYKVSGAISSGPTVAPPLPPDDSPPASDVGVAEPPKSISFSIKPKHSEAVVALRAALPCEASSSDEERSDGGRAAGRQPTRTPTPSSSKGATVSDGPHDRSNSPNGSCDERIGRSQSADANAAESVDVPSVVRVDPPSDAELSREKLLQMERRKKAMAFLHQIKATHPPAAVAFAKTTSSAGSDAESIHSVRSSPDPPATTEPTIIVLNDDDDDDEDCRETEPFRQRRRLATSSRLRSRNRSGSPPPADDRRRRHRRRRSASSCSSASSRSSRSSSEEDRRRQRRRRERRERHRHERSRSRSTSRPRHKRSKKSSRRRSSSMRPACCSSSAGPVQATAGHHHHRNHRGSRSRSSSRPATRRDRRSRSRSRKTHREHNCCA